MFFVGCSEQSENSSHTKASAHQTVQKEKKNNTTEKKYNEIDEDKAEEHLLKKTEEIYQYLLENDWKSLHDIIHPEEGITMTFHRMLDAYREFPIPIYVEDPNFSRFDFLDSIQQNKRVFWGFSNTDDEHYFYMTISDYINHFLLHHCDNPQLKNCYRKLHYTTFAYEEIQPINHHDENTDASILIENIRSEIPNGRFVEVFSPATEKNHWQKMRFVFLQHEDKWYLRAIIRHAHSFDEH